MRRYLRDPTFSRFDTIPECDGHTHRRTHRQTDRQDTRRRHIPRLARRRAVKTDKTINNRPYSNNTQLANIGWMKRVNVADR